MNTRNIAASVRAKLLDKAKRDNVDFQFLLTRYAIERLLYRLSVSSEKDHFLLKGALLFDLWYEVPLRPTRDIDLLGFGLAEIPHLVDAFMRISTIPVDDGIIFDPASIRAEEIRKVANYAGIRLSILSTLDQAKSQVQVDVGYGDPVTPAPEVAEYPTIFPNMPAPNLRVYPRYTVVAEKLDAILSLGIANSRMKDYFDLWVILRDQQLDNELLAKAVSLTLAKRGTIKPQGVPLGLSDQFAADAPKVRQWDAFINRNRLNAGSLEETVRELRRHLEFLFNP